MHIISARISNFKEIKDSTYEFRPGFNLIKGENGKCKTSIIEALAIGLSGFQEGVDSRFSLSFSDDDVRENYQSKNDGAFGSTRLYPVEVTLDLQLDDNTGIYEKQLSYSIESQIGCACLSSDKKLLAIAKQSAIEVWDLDTDSCKSKIPFGLEVNSIAFTTDGHTIFAGIQDSNILCFDIETGKCLKKLMFGDAISSIYADSDSIIVSSGMNTYKRYDASGRVINELHTSSTAAQSSEIVYKNHVYIGDAFGGIQKHEIANNDLIMRFEMKRPSPVEQQEAIKCLAVSNDGSRIVSGSSSTIGIWNSETGDHLKDIPIPSGINVNRLAISANFKWLAGASADNRIRIWDLETGQFVKTLYGLIWSACFMAFIDDTELVAVGKKEEIKIWNIKLSKLHWLKIRSSENVCTTTSSIDAALLLAEQLHHMHNSIMPVLCYHGASRAMNLKISNFYPSTKKYTRKDGYLNSLIGIPDLQSLFDWCFMMEFIAFQRKTNMPAYEAVKNAVTTFMGHMNHEKKYTISLDRESFDLVFTENSKSLPINKFSTGYQSLIWMIFDIAYRMALLNPALRGEIVNSPGIVLIDELDIHLHPKWQWKVIDALKQTFPNVQFIATTHAPILFVSSKNVYIIDIEEEKPVYSESIYGYDIGNSVRKIQGANEVPEEIKKLEDEFYKAMDQREYKEAESILAQIEKTFTMETPFLVRLKTMYAIESDDEVE